MGVQFHFQNVITLRNRNALKQFLVRLTGKEGKKLESLSIIFCDDEYLLHINRDFLQHDYYTDIITFDLQEPSSIGICGELYISTDRVRDNARTYHSTIQRELHRVIFHGLLHLCGYKDKTKSHQETMRKKEDFYLTKYFS